jgi:hypothetical protein
MDFTIDTYKKLLNTFISKEYRFITVSDYIHGRYNSSDPIIMLRHDVEARYENALQLAQIQAEAHIKGTYYFRLFPKKKNEHIIRRIASMGHEIGYHYDDLSHCHGNLPQDIERFKQHLAWLRQFAPVTSIAMEGAPMSKYDNRDLWSKPSLINTPLTTHNSPLTTHNSPLKTHYSDFGITSEPYFDLDFDKLFYLTDTARRWDGWKYSRRDKLKQQQGWIQKGWKYHGSCDIIKALQNESFPTQLMMTFHPQRWAANQIQWTTEFIGQHIKNLVKQFFV